MPGKRIYDPSLIRTTFVQAMLDSGEVAELLVDWDGLNEARPIALKLVGNTRFQGSDDGVQYSDTIAPSNTHVRFSTNGGAPNTWIVFKVSACDGSETPIEHDPVTIGSPAGGLSITGQQLSILAATQTSAGHLSAADKVKIDNLTGYSANNTGSGVEVFKDLTPVTNVFNFRSLVAGGRISITEDVDTILIDLANVPSELMSAITASYVYENTATLIADQATHVNGQIYQVQPNTFYKYNGTTVGDISDYTPFVDPSLNQKSLYTVRLPTSTTVAGRIAGAVEGIDYPTGWVLTPGTSSVDINILHGLGRRVAGISIFSEAGGTKEQQLFDTAAHNGVSTLDINNLLIESLATINTPIKIYINFV